MNKKTRLLILASLGLLPSLMTAQNILPSDSLTTVKFKNSFVEVQNRGFFILGADASHDIYNINGQKASNYKSERWTIAPMLNRKVLYYDGKHIKLSELSDDIYSRFPHDPTILKLKKSEFNDTVEDLVYSPDGTYFLVGTGNGRLIKCSTLKKDKKHKLLYDIKLDGSPSKIIINKKADAALVAAGSVLDIINLERGVKRAKIEYDAEIRDIAYSYDCLECAVLLCDGTLHIINTTSTLEKRRFNLPYNPRLCCYTMQGKYLMIADDNGIRMLNILTGDADYRLPSSYSDILGMDATFDSDKAEWLICFYNSEFSGLPLSLIERYHTIDLKRELDLRMAEWSKIKPGESEVDYRNRVNDATRAKYALQLERELVTQMAGDIIGQQKAKFGNYIESNQALSINFDGMPSIYLNIPAEDLVELKTIEDLEFFNTVYGLTEEDKFEVIYTEARNKSTGKVYIYDNLSRKSMTFDEDSFVPMEVVQLASIEAARLEEIKQEAMKKAINENILSDHTQITVSTDVEQDVDADGNKILNYNINYQYDVEEEYSARDDFKAGKYNTVESNAALQMIDIINKSLNADFAKYTTSSKKLIISVTGSADAIPIMGKLKYNGEYGDIEELLVYQNEELSTMTVTESSGMTSNEQLAMIRAYGMTDYLKKNVVTGLTIPTEERYNIEVSDEEGGQFRRIKVSLKFVDTFK